MREFIIEVVLPVAAPGTLLWLVWFGWGNRTPTLEEHFPTEGIGFFAITYVAASLSRTYEQLGPASYLVYAVIVFLLTLFLAGELSERSKGTEAQAPKNRRWYAVIGLAIMAVMMINLISIEGVNG
jgi:hypothetical protein